MRIKVDLNSPDARVELVDIIHDGVAWLAKDDESDLDFSVDAPCRIGKSDLIRSFVARGYELELIGHALIVSPQKGLAVQILDKNRLRKWQKRWRASGSDLKHVSVIKQFSDDVGFGGEWILSTNIQQISRPHQLVFFQAWIEEVRYRTGKRPLVIFDETHRYTCENHWGDAIRLAKRCGAFVLVLTGTAFRYDNADLEGFPQQPGITEEKTVRFFKPHTDPTKLNMHIRRVADRAVQIRADQSISYHTAWNKGYLAHPTFVWIDPDMRKLDLAAATDEGPTIPLSSLPRARAQDALRSVCEHPITIAQFVAQLIVWLNTFRAVKRTADATAILYGLDDRDDIANRHLNQVRKELRRQSHGQLRMKIATLKGDRENGEDHDEEQALDTIKAFTDDTKPPPFDVLGVKGMAGEGIDSDRICVVGLLHSTRSENVVIQQICRGANPYNGLNQFRVICLKDKFMYDEEQDENGHYQDIYIRFIREQGGEASIRNTIDETVEVIDRKDKDRDRYVVAGIGGVSASDDAERHAAYAKLQRAVRLVEIFPYLAQERSLPEIGDLVETHGIKIDREEPEPTAEEFVDTGELCEHWRKRIFEHQKTVAKWLFIIQHGRPCNTDLKRDRDLLGECKSAAAKAIKQRTRIFDPWDAKARDTIKDPARLELIAHAFENYARELMRQQRKATA